MGTGLAKEAYDEFDYGGFDNKDLIADSIGCFIGITGIKYLQLYQEKDTTGIKFTTKF